MQLNLAGHFLSQQHVPEAHDACKGLTVLVRTVAAVLDPVKAGNVLLAAVVSLRAGTTAALADCMLIMR